jgi:hypothetical protein
LQELGVRVEDIQPSPKYPSHPPALAHEPDSQDWETAQANGPSRRPSNFRAASLVNQEETSLFRRHIANESGSLSQNPGFSMLRGTKLALFGMQVDLAEFSEQEIDLSSPKTHEGFAEHLFGRGSHAETAALPSSLDSAREYMRWYFQFLNPYTPVIDKRDMYALVGSSRHKNPLENS